MRTTVTLDPDVKELVDRMMRERSLTFKEALNQAVREALRPKTATPLPTLRLGGAKPGIDLHRATRISADLEDDALAYKLELRK